MFFRTVAGAAALLAAHAPAHAADTPLARCAEIATAADRLACYDKLAGRAPAEPPPAATTAEPSKLAPKDAPPDETPASSLMSKYWELDPQDQRGVFNFTGYRANYVLPLHATTNINRAPQSPTQAVVARPNYRNVEAKFQLSLRTKVLQDVGLPGGDLWLAFTQVAFWQIWNGVDSKPFRDTEYEPQAIYTVPTGQGLRALPLGWQWRFTQLGLAHQSNGQSDPLSRSWNRVWAGVGVERGPWSLTARVLHRLNERASSDNNPDLVSYRGRGEFQLNYAAGAHTAQVLWRTTLKDARYGALQFEYTYPVFPSQPNGLRWYFQAFSGYGETLTDYNFRQNSIGLGVSFLQF